MRSLLAAASLLLAALAGCSSPDDPPEAITDSSSSSPTLLVFEEPEPTTDTLHLVEAPHMAATLPSRTEAIRLPVPTLTDDVELAWRMPRPPMTTVVATAVFWVEVQGTVVNPPTGCFWGSFLRIEHANGWTGTTSCVDEPQVVPAGVRAIRMQYLLDTSDLDGDVLGLSLSAGGSLAPGASVSLLAGTVEFDSLLAIQGLQLPLDTQTYL